jgi:hypothetical protein
VRRFKHPVYLYKRDQDEIDLAYEQNKITKYRWDALKRNPRSFHTPFGYYQSDDPDILEPIPFELDVLEHAKKLLALRDENPLYQKYYSLRKLSYWVTAVTGREISHQGIRVRINDDYERQQKEQKELFDRVQEEIRAKAEYVNSDVKGSFTKRLAESP